jgi:hypothetical protein
LAFLSGSSGATFLRMIVSSFVNTTPGNEDSVTFFKFSFNDFCKIGAASFGQHDP